MFLRITDCHIEVFVFRLSFFTSISVSALLDNGEDCRKMSPDLFFFFIKSFLVISDSGNVLKSSMSRSKSS